MAKATAKPVQVTPADPTPAGPVATPTAYVTGSVKQDPTTLSVAVRTNIPDPYLGHAWGVMTVDRGGHYAAWEEVQNWDDINIPS